MALCEGAQTDFALIRFVARVDAQMLFVVALPRKALFTKRTANRGRRVHDEMDLQIRFVLEVLPADLARELFGLSLARAGCTVDGTCGIRRCDRTLSLCDRRWQVLSRIGSRADETSRR